MLLFQRPWQERDASHWPTGPTPTSGFEYDSLALTVIGTIVAVGAIVALLILIDPLVERVAPPDFLPRGLRRERPLAKRIAGLLALAGAAAFALLLLRWLPPFLATTDLQGKDRAQDLSNARTSILALGAAILAVVGAVYTARNFRLSQQGHVTDRFARAIDQIGNAAIAVRLGGIHALERVLRESPIDRDAISDVLATYVRRNASSERGSRGARADVYAALAVLGRNAFTGRRIYLGGVYLSGTQVPRADLSNAQLQRAVLSGVDLSGGSLSGADLTGADLRGATLIDVNFDGAILEGAQLQNAKFDPQALTAAQLQVLSRA